MIQAHASWSATRWQAQPQKKRPKISVPSSVTAKKMKPAFTKPSSRVYIDSDGSTGESVRPATAKCAMCRAISPCTPSSTAARHRLRREARTCDSEPVPATGSAGSATSIPTPQRPGRAGLALRAMPPCRPRAPSAGRRQGQFRPEIGWPAESAPSGPSPDGQSFFARAR